MIIPNISKFEKAVILSKIDFPFVYKAHAQQEFFLITSKPEVTGLSLFSIVIPEAFSRVTQAAAALTKLKSLWRYNNISFGSKVKLMRTYDLGSKIQAYWGGRVARWGWVNFQCQDVLQCWIRVGQGPTAVGAGGVIWTFFLSPVISLFFLPLSGRRPNIIWNTSKGR